MRNVDCGLTDSLSTNPHSALRTPHSQIPTQFSSLVDPNYLTYNGRACLGISAFPALSSEREIIVNWKNSLARYGVITKFFHWTIFFGIVFQYLVGNVMIRVSQSQTALGYSQGTLYNWHKSIGLIIFGLVVFRYLWRRLTPLPDWAHSLSERERTYTHWVERILYISMFLMPISGYLFVMAGGYGVHFFGLYHLPNPIGEIEPLALAAQYTHRFTSIVMLITLILHIGFVLKHQFANRDRLANRMLPFTHQ